MVGWAVSQGNYGDGFFEIPPIQSAVTENGMIQGDRK